MDIKSYFTDSSTRVPASIVTFTVTLISAKVLMNMIWKDNVPPGPRGIPILGFLPFFGKKPHITFTNLRKKYGDIFSIQMGSFPAIVLNGKQLIREALVDRGDDFSGKPAFYSNSVVGKETLGFGEFSDVTILHRKMASQCLYQFSNARKNPIEDIVNYEARMIASEFVNNKKAFDPHDIIFVSVGSVIFQICYGKDSNIREEDSSFRDFIINSEEFIKFLASGNPVDVMPFLRFIMPWKVSGFVNLVEEFKNIRIRKINELMKSYSPSHMRHLADALIAVYYEEQKNPDSKMSEERIFATLQAITGAGFGTISTTLHWSFLYLAARPEIQAKLHKEIDDVIGQRQPMLTDKADMHYTMAFINEVWRHSSFVPLAIPHAATKDTELRGYTIRKGTIVFPNMYSISHDEETWGDAFNFRPERYLDADGKLDKTVTEKFNIFSMGRRKCLGEFLARIEVFLFLVGILQNCKVSKPAHVKEYSFDSVSGLTHSPQHYELCATTRD